MKGTVERWRVRSNVLRDNPLGDPAERDLFVYLPPGRTQADCADLPLIVLLSGFVGRGRMMLADNLYSPGIDDRADRLIAAGCPPFMVALPDCSTALGGSQYLNSAAVGRYQDHLLDEVLEILQQKLQPRRVGLAGKSSGGYGAMRLAMAAPGRVDAVACHSGDCYFEYGYLPDIPKAAATLARAGSVEAFLAAFHAHETKTSEQIIALSVIAMSACYSPNGDGGFDLPFDMETGEFRADVFDRWLMHDIYRMVDAHVDVLQRLSLLHIDAGTRDEFHLQLGARLLSRKLTAFSVQHDYEEFDGGHFSTSYRYDVSLPKLARALST